MNTEPDSTNTNLPQDIQVRLIDKIAALIKEHYAIERNATAISDALSKSFYEGEFESVTSLDELGKKATEILHTESSDLHFRVSPLKQLQSLNQQDFIEHWFTCSGRDRSSSHGLPKADIIEANIGYIKTEGFFSPELSFPRIDAAMSLLKDTDAIIIDLRSNGGGKPKTVQYFCSYFFDEKILLNSLIWRKDKKVDDYWTLKYINGKKIPDIDLYILTSSKTFSAGEEFAYNMQNHHKRSTLIGEQTGGGANPGDIFIVDNLLEIFIPTGQAFNPKTQTNWEGVGVKPDIEINSEQALTKAIELAKISAEKNLQHKKATFMKFCERLMNTLTQADNLLLTGETQAGLAAINNGIAEVTMQLEFQSMDLKWLSNQYRGRFNNPRMAELIESRIRTLS